MIAMTPFTFRQLVVVNLVVPFVGVAVDLVRSPPSRNVDPLTMSDGIQAGIGLLFLVAFVSTSIGLYLFARWSRPMALWSTVAAAVSIVFDGPYQTDAMAEAVYQLSTLLSGATLAAAYWSPVGALFEPGRAEDELQEVFR